MHSSAVQRLPEGMARLEEVKAVFCSRLAADWLPASSSVGLLILDLSYSTVTCVPEGLSSLQTLHICSCKHLTADCLPASRRLRGDAAIR
jgi:hypothetical protein